MKFLFVILSLFCSLLVSFENQAGETQESENQYSFRYCHNADLITDTLPVNNSASQLEVCFSQEGEKRRLRLYDNDSLRVEIIEPLPIQVRTRVFVCEKYFLVSDGTDSVNVLGHYFDNYVYRISDGVKMTSFSSEDLMPNDCSIFVN